MFISKPFCHPFDHCYMHVHALSHWHDSMYHGGGSLGNRSTSDWPKIFIYARIDCMANKTKLRRLIKTFL